jgi:CrcB protein
VKGRLRFELWELALVATGAVPGALLRWQADVRLGSYLGGAAGADLLVNLVGSFVLGVLVGPVPVPSAVVLLVGIGFCGSLTTFSSWMLDVVRLHQGGHGGLAVLLVAGSLALGLLAAVAGQRLSPRLVAAGAWFRRPGPPRSRQ